MSQIEDDICKKIAARLYRNINYLKDCVKKDNHHQPSFEKTIELFENYVSEIEHLHHPAEIKEKIFYLVWEGNKYRIVIKNGASEDIFSFLEQLEKEGREVLKELLRQFDI